MRHFLLILLLLFPSFLSVAQDCRLILSGHIEDADSKEKLAGATVSIAELDIHFITDDNGDFRYNNVCSGTYTVEVSHEGCETIRISVTLTKNRHLDILMPHLRNNLEKVVVSAEKKMQRTGFHQQLNAAQLEASKGGSFAEALSKINGVNILQTGSTISKPVIHGLHSNRILTINNGIRQEGQQWGNEHAPEIDTYIADKLTVIKGVDELKYGSDAIGGVILVDPKPIRALPGSNAEINTAFFTNNNQYAVSGIFEHQLKKLTALSYRIQGTFKKAGNVNTPGYRLNNTGLQEENFSLTANWKKEHYHFQAYYSQFATEIGIFSGSHIGNITDLQRAIDQDKPADIFLGKKTYVIDRPKQEALHRLFKLKAAVNKNEHVFNLTVAGQYNHRDEYDIVRSNQNKRPQLSLAIITLSEEFSYEHPLFHGLRGTAGISLMQQDNTTSGRYLIPKYTSGTYGAYWVEKWNKNKWNIEGGVRFDNKAIHTRRMQFGGTITDHDFNFLTFASSANAGYGVTKDFKVNGGISLSSRSPHVNELLIDGIHHGAATYEQGDINLKTEKSVNISIGMNYGNTDKKFSAQAYIYRNTINDFIYQQPKPDEPVLTVRGAFPKIQYQQTDAYLHGADVSARYHFHKYLALSSRLSVLRARNRKIDDWLILMPADRWSNELTWNLKKNQKFSDAYVSAEFVSVFKPRVPGDKSGRQDYKEPPPAYSLLNINASSTVSLFGAPVTASFGITNVLNTVYRNYMNSFRYYTDEMGRNISVRLKIPFENITGKHQTNNHEM